MTLGIERVENLKRKPIKLINEGKKLICNWRSQLTLSTSVEWRYRYPKRCCCQPPADKLLWSILACFSSRYGMCLSRNVPSLVKSKEFSLNIILQESINQFRLTFSIKTALVAWKHASFCNANTLCSRLNPVFSNWMWYPRLVTSSKTIPSVGTLKTEMTLK